MVERAVFPDHFDLLGPVEPGCIQCPRTKVLGYGYTHLVPTETLLALERCKIQVDIVVGIGVGTHTVVVGRETYYNNDATPWS